MTAESFPDRLAAEVRARRGRLRLSQRDLAELAGVSERFVRFVEQGKRSVQLDSLLALLDTLGLELRLGTRTSSAARALEGAAPDGGHPAVELQKPEAPRP
ncbi:transcriptional regulator [Arthrobacter sp. PAMC25564]|uniref:type II toxin-antitoxin system Y4mF family antitoxin n=1 Tax=Arthrobacter sp. PAMC25564 TaxID=2565366 RepID=UPI0010A29B29|nr:type II toxin-antitoxin system Y4mF family antitoxin [Arthrobacter sp. PAMC25564]QCB96177.1 transcriptional regulator [Arthrobacter sp. PAMC25564]